MAVAKMVGSNRVIQGCRIVHVLGDPDLPSAEEKALRQSILQRALEMLEKETDGSWWVELLTRGIGKVMETVVL